jgi:hypothetical protein
MILLNPFALLFALAIGLVLLMHFRRPKTLQSVSNLQLWQTQESNAIHRRPVLERIRKNWLLILQILFLAFAVLALARPSILFWENPRWIVFVIDCSASMNSLEHGQTRLDRAREKVIILLDEVRRNDQILIVQSRPQPVLKTYSGSDKSAMRSMVKNLAATEAAVDLSQALILALTSLPKTEAYEAFVISDFAQNVPLPVQNAKVHFIQVGESNNNAAITRFSIRSNPYSSYDREVFSEIANFSDHLKNIRFVLSSEGTNLLSEEIKLGSGERKSFVAPLPLGYAGIIQSSIDVKDDLDTDNRAYAVLDPGKKSVLLVTKGNEFLEKALRVNSQVTCTAKKPEECVEELQKKYDVIILDGVELHAYPPANYFILKHAQAAGTSHAASIYNERNLVSLLPNHPVMTYVNLGNVVVEEAMPLQVPFSGSILVEGKGKPLLIASESGSFRTVALGFDLRSSNFPLTLSFPIFISNAINWLSSETGEQGNQISVGTLLRWRIPASESIREVSITDPKGIESKSSWLNGIPAFPTAENIGIYYVRKGGTTERFAVNLLNEQESNIRPAFKPATDNGRFSDVPTLARTGREIWRILLMISLMLLAMEWFHYHRIGARKRPGNL